MSDDNEPWTPRTRDIIAALVGGVILSLLGLDRVGEYLPGPLRILLGLAVISNLFFYQRYDAILAKGNASEGTDERDKYQRLRETLVAGGTPDIIYRRWLGVVLDRVDEFFGDAGRTDKSWIARVLHLQTDGPRWTARSFDRCLLLALIYPILTIYAAWAYSGHVGIAEHALHLPPDEPTARYPGLWRGLNVVLVLLEVYSIYRFMRASGFRQFLWVAFAVAGAFAVAVAVAGAVAVGIYITAQWAQRKDRLGIFLSIFLVAACLFCLGAPFGLAPLRTWDAFGPLLLFYGLLTLVNAPIDWFALGFTRALLRKGLAQRGWWPFAYAGLDVLVAAALIATLAFAMVLAVQTFDDVAAPRAGPDARILPLQPLFAGLRSNPTDYQYWWVWFLLFSSMIPAGVNVSIALASFLRAWPRVNAWIVGRLPGGRAPNKRDRHMIAGVLTAQLVGGAALSVVAFYVIAFYVLPFGLPQFSSVLRDFAGLLADYNAPERFVIWFAGAR